MIMTASGGIGNQLFCLGAALAISQQRGINIKIYSNEKDFSAVYNDAIQNMEYDSRVEIIFSKKKNFWITYFCGLITSPKAKKILRLKVIEDIIVIQETPWQFPFDLLQISSKLPFFLLGYFQNTQLIQLLSIENRAILNHLITATSSFEANRNQEGVHQIGLHIRRGDYRLIPEYGVLSTTYFSRILSKIIDGKCKLVVSSDDEEILKEFESYEDAVTLSPSCCSSIESMRILAESDEFIMSNSTFSFWIAWAISLRGGIVHAPEPWFLNVDLPEDYLYLREFIRHPSIFEKLNEK